MTVTATAVLDISIGPADDPQDLDFGRLIGPQSTTLTLIIPADLAAAAEIFPDTGDGRLLDDQQPGKLKVTGDTNETFEITTAAPINGTGDCSGFNAGGSVILSEITTNPSGVALAFFCDFSDPGIFTGECTLPGFRGLVVGGTLVIGAGTSGQGSCTYEITVTYDSCGPC